MTPILIFRNPFFRSRAAKITNTILLARLPHFQFPSLLKSTGHGQPWMETIMGMELEIMEEAIMDTHYPTGFWRIPGVLHYRTPQQRSCKIL